MKKIIISPISVVWFLVLAQAQRGFFLPMLLAIGLHESGHLLVARILKIKIKAFRLSVLGARIETDGELSYKDEFLLAMGGPLSGFLGFLFAIFPALNWQAPVAKEFLLPFSIISLCLTLFNLIPLASLDGGRMLFCAVCTVFSLDFATKILKIISFFTLFSFWILSVYLMLKASLGLSMLVFCCILFSKCFIFDTKNRDYARF